MVSKTYVEMFAGIGGMSHGLTSAGFECVGFAEWDKFAHRSYNILHNKDGHKEAWTDVTRVSDDDLRFFKSRRGHIDLLAGGFPCQAFSIAGKRRGLDDTRGTLFYEVARWASILEPDYLLLENVKGLLSHDGGATFRVIIETFDELGYDLQWQVLNSKNYVPQNRERIFIVGHLRGRRRPEVFPLGRENESAINVVGKLDIKGNDQIRRVYGQTGFAPALQTMQGGNREPKILIDDQGRVNKRHTLKAEAPTLRAQTHGNEPKILIDLNLEPKITDTARCIKARYTSGVVKHKASNSGVLVRPILTPDRIEKRQNGIRMKDDGEPSFTLTAQDRHGILIDDYNGRIAQDDGQTSPTLSQECGNKSSWTGIKLMVKENTKKGFAEAGVGDTIDFTQPNSTTRRGRVQQTQTQTLTCNPDLGVVTKGYRIRKLTPLECFRLQSYPDAWYHELVAAGISNSQLYKMAGNGVTSLVAEDIGRALLRSIEVER